MSDWACQNCGCAGVTIPHSYRRSPICDWCADDFRSARKRWCAHCRQGQPSALWASPHAKRCRVCTSALWASPHAKRCRVCTSAYDAAREKAPERSRQLAAYYADPDRTIYRIRLKQMAERSCTRADQIFGGMRARIALAELVVRTPGWSWTMRARRFGGWPQSLATNYRRQCAGLVRDADMADVARASRGDI